MKRILFFLICLCVVTRGVAQDGILIYTKNGKGYVHDNIPAAVAALKQLAADNKVTADATDDPATFTPEKLKSYKCVVFASTNNEAFDTEAQKQAFVDYIHAGGGFVGIHSASGSERQWPWFWAMLGGKFVRHPELQKFTIRIIDKTHPSTKFMGETWEWEDECYYTNQLNPDIKVLLAVDLNSLRDDKKGEYPGAVFGTTFPLAWYHEFEGGRQFYTALGHKSEYYQDAQLLKHIWGGIAWAMERP